MTIEKAREAKGKNGSIPRRTSVGDSELPLPPEMKLSDYLIAYLEKAGVSHLFGIPGDLVIKLFLKFGKPSGIDVIPYRMSRGWGLRRMAMPAAPDRSASSASPMARAATIWSTPLLAHFQKSSRFW